MPPRRGAAVRPPPGLRPVGWSKLRCPKSPEGGRDPPSGEAHSSAVVLGHLDPPRKRGILSRTT